MVVICVGSFVLPCFVLFGLIGFVCVGVRVCEFVCVLFCLVGLAWFGLVWFELVWVWFGLVWCGSVGALVRLQTCVFACLLDCLLA